MEIAATGLSFFTGPAQTFLQVQNLFFDIHHSTLPSGQMLFTTSTGSQSSIKIIVKRLAPTITVQERFITEHPAA